jgi:Nickel responsive protein SCO4226-like
VLYAAKCYWPRVTPTELADVSARAEMACAAATDVTYVGSLLFADDDVSLCLFEGPSRSAVQRATEQAGVPWERLMASAWVSPSQVLPSTAQAMPLPASSSRQLGDKQ